MIDHVLACLTGDAENLIEPASAFRPRPPGALGSKIGGTRRMLYRRQRSG